MYHTWILWDRLHTAYVTPKLLIAILEKVYGLTSSLSANLKIYKTYSSEKPTWQSFRYKAKKTNLVISNGMNVKN